MIDDETVRVVGWEDARPHEPPSYVFLYYDRGRKCGVSVMNQEWTVTAAHCLTSAVSGNPADLKHFFVVDGETSSYEPMKQRVHKSLTTVHHMFKRALLESEKRLLVIA